MPKRGYKQTKEHIENKRKTLIGRTLSEEHKKNISLNAKINPNYSMRGKHQSEEMKKRISENKERSRKISIALKGRNLPEWHKRKISESSRGKKLSEKTRQKIGERMMGKRISPKTEFKKGQLKGKTLEEIWGMEKAKEIKIKLSKSRSGIKYSELFKKRISETLKEKFRDKQYKESVLKKLMQSRYIKPNKPEGILINLMQKYNLPYKYVGNWKFVIEGKNPDFVNCNGQKKVIELFGEYWHTGRVRKYEDTEEGRIKHFSKYGYDCLVIWDYELKDLQKLTEKILNFDR